MKAPNVPMPNGRGEEVGERGVQPVTPAGDVVAHLVG